MTRSCSARPGDSTASNSATGRELVPRWCCRCGPPTRSPVCWSRFGPPGRTPFSAEQLDMMAAFADQAALAWQLASTQRQMRELEHPDRPRPHRPRPARPRHPAAVRRRARPAGDDPAGARTRGAATTDGMRRRSSAGDSGDPHRDLRPARRVVGGHPAAAATRRGRRAVRRRRTPHHRAVRRVRCRSSTPRSPTTPKRWSAKRSATPSGTPRPPPLAVSVVVEDELSIEVIDNGSGHTRRDHR